MAYQRWQVVTRAAEVMPSDTTDIPNISTEDGSGNLGCSLYTGDGGDIKVKTVAGDIVTLFNLPGGTFIPLIVNRVYATGTSASSILALW